MSQRRNLKSLEYFTIGPVMSTAGLTGDSVDMAFMPPGVLPDTLDWVDASWTSDVPPYIQTLVAGDGVDSPPGNATILTEGIYVVWVRIIDAPEHPVRPVDVVTMYAGRSLAQ